MSLIRWYRPRNLPTVWDHMESMARDMARLMPWTEETEPRALGIPVDIYETETEVVVKAEVPGVKKEIWTVVLLCYRIFVLSPIEDCDFLA